MIKTLMSDNGWRNSWKSEDSGNVQLGTKSFYRSVGRERSSFNHCKTIPSLEKTYRNIIFHSCVKWRSQSGNIDQPLLQSVTVIGTISFEDTGSLTYIELLSFRNIPWSFNIRFRLVIALNDCHRSINGCQTLDNHRGTISEQHRLLKFKIICCFKIAFCSPFAHFSGTASESSCTLLYKRVSYCKETGPPMCNGFSTDQDTRSLCTAANFMHCPTNIGICK